MPLCVFSQECKAGCGARRSVTAPTEVLTTAGSHLLSLETKWDFLGFACWVPPRYSLQIHPCRIMANRNWTGRLVVCSFGVRFPTAVTENEPPCLYGGFFFVVPYLSNVCFYFFGLSFQVGTSKWTTSRGQEVSSCSPRCTWRRVAGRCRQ